MLLIVLKYLETYLVKKFDSEEHNTFISKLNNLKVNTCVYQIVL